MVSLRDHPRARQSIQRSKAFGAMIGFFAVAATTYMKGATLDQVGMRALMGGIGGWMVAWAGAVAVWQQMLVGETKAAVRRAVALRQQESERR
jgi:hypothetical protein